MSDLVRLSVSIEKSLFERLERLVRETGISNRSEFVRNLVRRELVERQWAQNDEVVGAITLVYDHEVRELSGKLTHLQHHHHRAVLATTHVHLDERICVEMILVRGRAGDIRELSDRLGLQKGVFHSSLSLSSTGASLR
jgi:CopG family nickel-responsive transcriptional regulator